MPWVAGWWRGPRAATRRLRQAHCRGPASGAPPDVGGRGCPDLRRRAPRSGARARWHLGAHHRDPAGTPAPGRGTELGEDPSKRPAVAAASGCRRREPGDLRGVGLEERSPQNPQVGSELYTEAGGGGRARLPNALRFCCRGVRRSRASLQ